MLGEVGLLDHFLIPVGEVLGSGDAQSGLHSILDVMGRRRHDALGGIGGRAQPLIGNPLLVPVAVARINLDHVLSGADLGIGSAALPRAASFQA